jgi:hypothetical protein
VLIRSRRHRARRLAARILSAARGDDRPPTYRMIVVVDLNRPSEPGQNPPQSLR